MIKTKQDFLEYLKFRGFIKGFDFFDFDEPKHRYSNSIQEDEENFYLHQLPPLLKSRYFTGVSIKKSFYTLSKCPKEQKKVIGDFIPLSAKTVTGKSLIMVEVNFKFDNEGEKTKFINRMLSKDRVTKFSITEIK